MPDVVVTVPKSFEYAGKLGLAAWIAEGAAAGDPVDPDDNELWSFTTFGAPPDIEPGERVYIVCEGRLRGYSPLVELHWDGKLFGAAKPTRLSRWAFVRGNEAVAVTIPQPVTGFRGWRYRWWEREIEVPFPDWRKPCAPE